MARSPGHLQPQPAGGRHCRGGCRGDRRQLAALPRGQLLPRVGKINKPEYFVENQAGGENRHINLTPNVSLLIITGHVKDGVELAKEYNLPASIIPFIQQHHGTTLVEYFFRQACGQQENCDPDGPEVQDHQYRYEGPAQDKEMAIVMLADCVESACRTLDDPTASRVEGLVEDSR